MPPITTMASSSPENATEIGSAEVMRLLNSSMHAGKAGYRGRKGKGHQLIAVRRIADELRALLVLADGNQHMPRGRAMEAPEQVNNKEAYHGRQRIERRIALQPNGAEVGPDDAAKTVLAAGHRCPTKRHNVHHGGQSHGQQRRNRHRGGAG